MFIKVTMYLSIIVLCIGLLCQRISTKGDHGVDVEDFGRGVLRATPGRTQEHHVCTLEGGGGGGGGGGGCVCVCVLTDKIVNKGAPKTILKVGRNPVMSTDLAPHWEHVSRYHHTLWQEQV